MLLFGRSHPSRNRVDDAQEITPVTVVIVRLTAGHKVWNLNVFEICEAFADRVPPSRWAAN